jgi:hypothetical protein
MKSGASQVEALVFTIPVFCVVHRISRGCPMHFSNEATDRKS